MIDAEAIKQQVDIVDVIGKFVELKKQGSSYSGNCPFHNEKTGSFNVDQGKQSYKCFGCDVQGDVIDFIQKHKSLDFKAACEFLGADIPEGHKPPPRPKQAKKKATKPVPLKFEDAKNHYTKDVMCARANFIFKDNPHEFKQAWSYKNENGEVELVAVRFEDKSGAKTVLSMYWNGKTIKLAGYPVLLFNRDQLTKFPDKPVLMVEGEKAAKAAEGLTDFVAVTWNGGGTKVKDVDWSPLKNREVFIFPDDDQQVYKEGHPRAGQLLPPSEQPGNKAAAVIKKKLPHAKIVKPVVNARKVKPSGADIVEVLEVMTVEEVTAHILSSGNGERTTPDPIIENREIAKSDSVYPQPSAWPFQVLGIADDGKAYFIGVNGILYSLNPTSFTKTQLLNLANIRFWREDCEATSAKGWESVMSDLIESVNSVDFDPEMVRGRGAWREPDGRICYHDGRKTVGEYAPERVFARRPQRKIGLESTPATPEERARIYRAARELTFSKTSDCIRVLGWAVLAPFAGALPWRPSVLITADSGAGKSAVVNILVEKLSKSIVASGESSSPAGIRQNIGMNSCSVIMEEAEEQRGEYFSLMRQSTSDSSPDAFKGTQDGKGTAFKLRSMFMFVSIDPTIDKEADENRIFRVGLTKGKHSSEKWVEVEKNMINAITDEIAKGVRSYTWKNLSRILDLAKEITEAVQNKTKFDNRTAYSDAILIAAYMAVFENKLNPEDEHMNKFIKLFYSDDTPEPRRNENEEMLEILLDSIVKGDSGHNYTIREVLTAIETEKVWSNADDNKDTGPRDEHHISSTYARRLAGMYGMGLSPDGNIAIAKNHREVMKMLDKGKGYQMQLMRHPRLVDRGKNVNLGGSAGVKNCVVIGWENEEA